ncbi:MAG: hypothetical protein JST98_02110 [Bacteroidetes bacterium]|nr:hypothetical protein [Bacteroidota bacterium]MBS1944004.1 hypothetical protein [Bacteroidota bacterium]
MNAIAQQEVSRLQSILKYGYGLVPIMAGADKFTNLLTDWGHYVPTWMAGMLPFGPITFMMVVGVIEIVAGILVLTRTLFGAYLVSAWLTLIAITLISSGQYLDVAVRDLVMAIGAYGLARLTQVTDGSTKAALA